MNTVEQTIQLRNGLQVWVHRIGTGDGIPLLTLHGGSGSGHDCLEPREKPANLNHVPVGRFSIVKTGGKSKVIAF